MGCSPRPGLGCPQFPPVSSVCLSFPPLSPTPDCCGIRALCARPSPCVWDCTGPPNTGQGLGRTPEVRGSVQDPHPHARGSCGTPAPGRGSMWDPSPAVGSAGLTPSTGHGVRGRGWLGARCHVPGDKLPGLCHVLTSVPIPYGDRAGHDLPGDPQAQELPARGERVRQAGAAGTATAAAPAPSPGTNPGPGGSERCPALC